MTKEKLVLATGVLLQTEVVRFMDDLKESGVERFICVRACHETSEGVQVDISPNDLLPPEVVRKLLQESLQRGTLYLLGWGKLILMVPHAA